MNLQIPLLLRRGKFDYQHYSSTVKKKGEGSGLSEFDTFS